MTLREMRCLFTRLSARLISLGEFWKGLHPLCRWGGDFVGEDGRPAPDGNHYSLEWQGRK